MSTHTLITGGCGFVGTNLADALLREGRHVVVLDDLSRPGVERNLAYLTAHHGAQLAVEVADVCDSDAVARVASGADEIFHLAGQVAVTTSLDRPVRDAAVNVQGTINVLEAARAQSRPPRIVFTSTNKVYGSLDDVALAERPVRYEPIEAGLLARGVSELRPLQFSTPYGCSKGAADQYVLDYSHSYGLPTVVFRMSCIYGTHQMGNEDQGWVAHFLIRAIEREPISIYGDGKQVRDVLWVGDLVDALTRASHEAERLAGRAFNIGGGARNAISLLELLDAIEKLEGRAPDVEFGDWRQGDQRYYVSDPRAFGAATGWRPRTTPNAGIRRLHEWLRDQHSASSEPLKRAEAARAA
jgi:CDP-paratose 2-epimerase